MSIITILDGYGYKHKISSSSIINRKAIYGILIKNNRLLMIKDAISNKWEFPGGGVEVDENILDSLKREFLEETNLIILDKEILNKNKIYSCTEFFFDIKSNQAWKTERSFFLISKVKGVLIENGNNNDVKQAKFFLPNDLLFSEVSKTIKQVIGAYLELQKKG